MSQLLRSTVATLAANNAASLPIQMLNANVTVLLSGTFVGTVTLMARQTGNPANVWVPIAGALTAPGLISVNNLAGDLEFQVVMTPFTSGSAVVYVAACPTS